MNGRLFDSNIVAVKYHQCCPLPAILCNECSDKTNSQDTGHPSIQTTKPVRFIFDSQIRHTFLIFFKTINSNSPKFNTPGQRRKKRRSALTDLVCKAPEFFLRVSIVGQITEHAMASSSFTVRAPWSLLNRLRTFLFSWDFRFPTFIRASLSADCWEAKRLLFAFIFPDSSSPFLRQQFL